MTTTAPATPTATAPEQPKPIKPVVSETNKPFWDGCRAHKLVAQKCTSCGEWRYPAADVCPNCLSPESAWGELSGGGTMLSYIIVHRGYHPYWAQRVPYNVAFIELDEGLRMFSNIVGTPNEKLAIGQRVKVAFEQRDVDFVVPVFEVVTGPQ
ncbi:MAG: OB-fold domain-containing protein [Hyphomicrobiales bacterium]|nr:OB-fold domain-containing protein [Hyphomicrobiales bacterium]